ncbi:hypothetical protein JCM19238_4902 [Vibrio ponticus]|nr:hypothetical protein JCM19238_4902 [Vibrio ponticus]
MVTVGKAAIKAPALSLRLAISEINTTIPAVSAYLVMIHSIISRPCQKII